MFYNECMEDELQVLKSFGQYMDVETGEEEGCRHHQPGPDAGPCTFVNVDSVGDQFDNLPIHMAALPGGRRGSGGKFTPMATSKSVASST